MSVLDQPLGRLDGTPATLGELLDGRTALVVNVASRCGLTSQYAGLERLHEQYADRGFTVLGVPCNQFAGQEPGTAEEISEFCSTTYGVTFPLTAKVEVNGEGRHSVFAELTRTPRTVEDEHGADGADPEDVQWNFEKFLLDGSGSVVARFAPGVLPDDPRLVEAIEAALPR